MSVSVADLLERYPEFTQAYSEYPGMVEACLEQAHDMVSTTVYGTKADHAIKALAAHYIAINPLGEMARLAADDGKTVYWMQFEQLRKATATGFRVI